MFNQFTWSDFFLTLIVTILFYYAIILYFFYHKDILARLTKPTHATMPFSFQEQENGTGNLPIDESDEYLLQTCTDEITAYLQEAKRKKCLKEEMLFALGRIIQKNTPRLNEDLRIILSNVIKVQSEDICAIHLSGDDLKAVWVKGE